MSQDRHELVIVGGGPAAMAAARGFRAVRDDGRIAMIADEGRMPYRRPPLSKELLMRAVTEAELPLEGDDWPALHRMDLVTGRAVALDPRARTVTLSGGRTLAYERCVLATGAEPARLPVRGVDDPAVRVLRSREDLWRIEHRLSHDTRVVVIGSGFIGCEIAASLRTRDLAVTLVSDERAPQEARLGAWAGDRLARWLRGEGVDLRLGQAVTRIERTGDALRVHRGPDDGTPHGDVVILAAGVRARSELAVAAGLDCPGGRVPTDERMRTAVPELWAAGDVCAARHALTGTTMPVEHWGDALAQGEVAGRSAAGEQEARWDAIPGFWSTIGRRTLKQASWGTDFDHDEVREYPNGAFSVRYSDARGRLVGVLAHECDADYEDGRRELAEAADERLDARPAG